MTAWQDYKKKRTDDLNNGAPVRPTDLLSSNSYTTEEIAIKRFSICADCPELIKLTSQCKKCGCFMKLKTKLKHAACPIGQW